MALRRLRKISDHEKGKIIEIIRAFLDRHEEIIFALLYGSLINPVIPGKYGDIDLALFIKQDHLNIPAYVFESHIETEVYHLLSSRGLNFIPTEALVINHAPYSFLSKLFKGEYILLKGDEGTLTDFIEEVGGRAMDNYHLRSESLREVVGG